jgi:glutamine amidotransferase
MIAIVDYGMGNLRSVLKAFEKVGAEAVVTSDARIINDASAVVLPGVGAFKDCVANLINHGLAEPVVRAIEKGKPFLGICLGLQMLFSESEEFGRTLGLGVFRGKVVRFSSNNAADKAANNVANNAAVNAAGHVTGGLKIPHMGWNSVRLKRSNPVFEGVGDGRYFYFVHSYYVVPDDTGLISGVTDYGVEFTSMIARDNVFAMQFHPEKSQRAGIKVVENFAAFARAN